MENYEKIANDFLKKTNTTFKSEFVANKLHFQDSKEEEKRDVYKITLTRGQRSYSFDFGQSINGSVRFRVFAPSGVLRFNDKKEAYKVKNKYACDIKENKDFSTPSAYDVLASITKNEIGTFKNFCSEFGYNDDSIKAEKIYNAVLEEYNNIKMLYSDDEIEEMQEIN